MFFFVYFFGGFPKPSKKWIFFSLACAYGGIL